MRYYLKFTVLLTIAVSAILGILSMKNNPHVKSYKSFEPVAVIELFTSQGCSSCPSADKLLSQTIETAKNKDQKIFALSYHVDYWNRLGWSDPFSNKLYSQRQYEYVNKLSLNGAYTPQMVVNGIYEFVGSDSRALSRAISGALNTNAIINFKILSAEISGKAVRVKFLTEGNSISSFINFALVSLNETTDIKRGENGGLSLKNENVVRQLISQNFSASGEIEFVPQPDQSAENTAVIAFIQDKNNYKILGAAMTRL